MILIYRKEAVIRLALGFGMLLIGLIIAGVTSHGDSRQLGGFIGVTLAIIGFLVFVFGCCDLLKAKGYDSSVIVVFLVSALCCSPFIFLAPLIILFGLN